LRDARRVETEDVWSISGVWRSGSIAGCAQTKSSSARRSRKLVGELGRRDSAVSRLSVPS
jgi:hypothetical protein